MGGNNQDSQAATTQAQTNAGQAATYNQAAQNLYGGVASNTAAMANPNALNISAPTGPSKLQFNAATQNTANQYKNAQGQLARSMALRGFGANSPSGMQAAGTGQLAADEADAQGQNFSNYTNQAYQTALSNFWNANQLQAEAAGQQGQLGMGGGESAANTYANLYQTSAQFNPWNTAINAIGTIGAATAGKVA